MDFLPINPASTNKVDTGINLANDGGSKSNTGYFSQRGSEEEKKPESVDEVKFSHSGAEDVEEPDEEIKSVQKIKNFFIKITNYILKLLGLKKEEIPNIYEKPEDDTD